MLDEQGYLDAAAQGEKLYKRIEFVSLQDMKGSKSVSYTHLLILDCQQSKKGGLPRTLPAHQTEHGFKFASRLEYPLDGSHQENLQDECV